MSPIESVIVPRTFFKSKIHLEKLVINEIIHLIANFDQGIYDIRCLNQLSPKICRPATTIINGPKGMGFSLLITFVAIKTIPTTAPKKQLRNIFCIIPIGPR